MQTAASALPGAGIFDCSGSELIQETEVGVTGVVGVLKGGQNGDKVVALRADFDALPVEELADVPFKSTFVDEDYPGGPVPVSHACGHETHAAMLMGAAIELELPSGSGSHNGVHNAP